MSSYSKVSFLICLNYVMSKMTFCIHRPLCYLNSHLLLLVEFSDKGIPFMFLLLALHTNIIEKPRIRLGLALHSVRNGEVYFVQIGRPKV